MRRFLPITVAVAAGFLTLGHAAAGANVSAKTADVGPTPTVDGLPVHIPPNGATRIVRANCPAHDEPLSGGWLATKYAGKYSVDAISVVSSIPTVHGWQLIIQDNTPGDESDDRAYYRAVVECAAF